MAVIFGTNGTDTFNGTVDNDVLYGWADGSLPEDDSGNDVIHGLGGDDEIYGGGGNDRLFADGGLLDYLYGGDGNDILTAGTGRGILLGGVGDDTLTGGTNNDVLFDDDFPVKNDPFGNDTMNGNGGGDVIASLAGIDTIDGGGGGDLLHFERLSATGALTLILAGPGVVATVLGDGTTVVNVEAIRYYGGSGVDTVTGLDGIDSLLGFDGNDVLNVGGGPSNSLVGGKGDDTLTGGTGNDSIYDDDFFSNGDNGADDISAGAGDDNVTSRGGIDTIDGGDGTDHLLFSRRDFALEFVLDLAVPGTVAGDGSSIANFESIEFFGGEGGDTVTALGLADKLYGYGGADKLHAGAGDDTLEGGGGNDLLDGGAGVDRMTGGHGDDTYIVDQYADRTVEDGFGGTDTVISSISHTMRNGIECLILTAGTNGIGNSLNNDITGNAENNLLNGAQGADTMHGGDGDDTYYVDNLLDDVDESGTGIDTVRSWVDYTLGNNEEKLYLTAGTNATGNGLSNFIYGNNAANAIDGKAGADQLFGYNGDDTYRVDSTGDRVFETNATAAGGIDRVFSTVNFTLSANVERLALQGSANINGTGNVGDNSVAGNSGNNFVDGKEGTDSLAGGLGKDNFVFSTALGATNIDYIFDFTAVDDTARLENAVFTVLPVGYLAVAAFHIGTAAAHASDRIIYNSATGALLYDADGNGAGAATQFATLATGLPLTNADFYVF